METLYDILEVSRKASKEIIEKAYKTLAKKYHPDVQTQEDKAYAEEMMKKINEAYSVLSDEQKRQEYDDKLEVEERKINNYQNGINNSYNENWKDNANTAPYNSNVSNNINNQNYNYHEYNQTENSTYGKNNKEFDEWREQYSKLNKKEQTKIRRKIKKEVNEEFRKQYEDYLRSLGYRIKHRWTFKDFVTISIIIIVFIIIFLILWWIPSTHKWMIETYNNNLVVKIIVNILIGIYKGIVQFCKNIFNF